MRIQSLEGQWKFRQVGSEEWLDATVPGCVHTDLMNLDLLPDPFIRDQELDVMWVAEKDWEYQTDFMVSDSILEYDKVLLVADGLDTLADVYLNGFKLGHAYNQFRRWGWSVKENLVSGQNNLRIQFSGPTTYVTQQQEKRQLKGVTQAIEGGPHLRKAPCQFGWDWGPMLPPMGIWKDIRLEARSTARFEDIHLRQIHKDNKVLIQASINIEKWKDRDIEAAITITAPNGQTYLERSRIVNDCCTLEVQIETPQLWWPNGYGSQDLYSVVLEIKENSQVLDRKSYNMGLRTLELRQEEDEFGKSFQFVVNGVPIFAKGSNWIPADSFLTRFSNNRLEKLIANAADSHQNMLRVWGGGIYEEERFYDLCDRYGILIWQDFIFSCSIYPLDDPKFHKNVQIEVDENIRRLRHRASLALWCGNNEMEWGWESWGWQRHPLEDALPELIQQYPILRFLIDQIGERDILPDWEILKEAYDRFFHFTLPEWVSKLDPDTPYWPSSPSSNTPFIDANGQKQGDAHYWDVWHGRKPFTAYRSTYPRFMSEFGFQAFPTMETIETYTDPEDRNLTSYIMEHHQRGNHGNGLIIAQMTDTFKMPKDFYAWIYLSMVLQAEGIRYGVEHWRRNMHRVSGTLYWQLNDCWPVASWASIDYFGRWKALHYAAKRFYEPVLLSIEDKSPVMDVHISNDLMRGVDGKIKWSLETVGGDILDYGEINFSASHLSDTLISSFDFRDQILKYDKRDLLFICEYWGHQKKISTRISTFVPNKHVFFKDPIISTQLHQDGEMMILNITAKSTARFVELKLEGQDVIFSDNYFDIPANRSVEITFKTPQGWDQQNVRKALRVYSLINSYQTFSR